MIRSGNWTKTLRQRARKLNRRAHASDIWLYEKWHELGLKDKSDRFNRPVGYYIADLMNSRFKYIVECDGGYHDLPEVRQYDAKRDEDLSRLGFKTFRVKHGDLKRLSEISVEILYIRRQKID